MHCKSYSHFFSKKFQHICVSLDVNFNESLTNDIVSFEQLGPDCVDAGDDPISFFAYDKQSIILRSAGSIGAVICWNMPLGVTRIGLCICAFWSGTSLSAFTKTRLYIFDPLKPHFVKYKAVWRIAISPAAEWQWSGLKIQGANCWHSIVTLTLSLHCWVMDSAHHLTKANIWPKFDKHLSKGSVDMEWTWNSRLKLVTFNCDLDLESACLNYGFCTSTY